MNFTITISGEKHELADGLAVLKAVMGDQVDSGSVLATLLPQQQPQQQVQPQQSDLQPQQPQQSFNVPPQQQTFNYQQPPVQQQPPLQQVPVTPAPSYTMEQLGVAAGPIIDAGRAPELTAWINQRGAQSLSQLDKSHYGEFATYLRSLGARI